MIKPSRATPPSDPALYFYSFVILSVRLIFIHIGSSTLSFPSSDVLRLLFSLQEMGFMLRLLSFMPAQRGRVAVWRVV